MCAAEGEGAAMGCVHRQGGEHQASHTFHTLQLGWVPGKCVHNNGHPTSMFAAAQDLPKTFTPVAKGLGLQWPDTNLKLRSSANQRWNSASSSSNANPNCSSLDRLITATVGRRSTGSVASGLPLQSFSVSELQFHTHFRLHTGSTSTISSTAQSASCPAPLMQP